VVLFSPGAKMRIGPGRLYVPLTEMLNAMGYLVLRFDFFGLGDSEGELEESLLVDVYSNIQVGRYVTDGQIALEWLRREHGSTRFIVGGLCGGALTGLLVAEREPSIEALLSIGMTVTLDSDSAMPSKYLTQFELAHLRQGYLAKLWTRVRGCACSRSAATSASSCGRCCGTPQEATPRPTRRRIGQRRRARAARSPPSSSPTSTRSSPRPSSPSSAAAGGR
jgi:pimeloyl-ACP methyl ester carboxylesterase